MLAQPLLVARRDRDRRRRAVVVAAPSPGGPAAAPPRRGAPPRRVGGVPAGWRSSGGRGVAARVLGPAARRRGRPRAEDREEDGVERRTCAASETSTARAVQYSRVRATGRSSVSASAKRAERSGVTGTPASCSRRPKAATSGGRSSSTVSSRHTQALQPRGADDVLVLAVLEHRAERAVDRAASSVVDAEQLERRQPVDRLGDPGRLLHVAVAHPRDRGHDLHRERLRRALHAAAHDLDLALGRRVVDPLVQAAALDRVVQVARAVGGQDDHRRVRRADRAELGDRHRRLGEQLEQERLEVVVGAVDLVDQQHRRPRAGVLERAQQRPADQVVGAEQVVLGEPLVVGLREPDAQQLAGIVPLVQRLGGVDAVVALQPDQRRVEDRRERLGRLGLADARPRPPAAAAAAGGG